MRWFYLLSNCLVFSRVLLWRFSRGARGNSAWNRQQQSVLYGIYQTAILVDDWLIYISCGLINGYFKAVWILYIRNKRQSHKINILIHVPKCVKRVIHIEEGKRVVMDIWIQLLILLDLSKLSTFPKCKFTQNIFYILIFDFRKTCVLCIFHE